MKFWGIFQNDDPGILNIEIFPGSFMNILQMIHTFFGGSRKAIVVFSIG